MPKPCIFVTGSSGQVGSAIIQLLGSGRSAAPSVEVLAPLRAELDLTDLDALRQYVRTHRPDWIVNPAAYTAVDRAESEPEIARTLNAEVPRVLGEEARTLGVPVLHFSTDYVFRGDGTHPYTETDVTAPSSVYGQTKLDGELALAATGAAHLILRTSWVYGATGKNFLLTILRAAQERSELRIVDDQHGAPTWSRDLARLTAFLIEDFQQRADLERRAAGATVAEFLSPLSGVYHATGSGETTWYGFAKAAVEARRAADPSAKFASLTPITTAEYPTPARRPANSRLDCTRLGSTFGFKFPSWRESLDDVLAELG